MKQGVVMAKKINFIDVYEDRIKQIELDIAKAVRKKDWTSVAKLRAEQEKLKDYVKKLREEK